MKANLGRRYATLFLEDLLRINTLRSLEFDV